MSLRAGGVGLNIPSADLVVLFDRWWNPAVEAQAVNRAHRLGRSTPLHVMRFLVRDSIEERIDAILTVKQQLFDDYVESVDVVDIPALTRNDLIHALGMSHYDTDAHRTPVLWRTGADMANLKEVQDLKLERLDALEGSGPYQSRRGNRRTGRKHPRARPAGADRRDAL